MVNRLYFEPPQKNEKNYIGRNDTFFFSTIVVYPEHILAEQI